MLISQRIIYSVGFATLSVAALFVFGVFFVHAQLFDPPENSAPNNGNLNNLSQLTGYLRKDLTELQEVQGALIVGSATTKPAYVGSEDGVSTIPQAAGAAVYALGSNSLTASYGVFGYGEGPNSSAIVGRLGLDAAAGRAGAFYGKTWISDNCPVSWWDCEWQNRATITMNNSASSENLSNFPMLVAFNATNIDYAQIQNGGQDIRFVDADGTLLAHEIENWNESGTSNLWVKVPQISSGSQDFIWIYYNNPSASNGENPSGVWTNGYTGVWHLKENPASGADSIKDSSPNAYHSTGVGATMNATNQITGKIGTAIDFNRTDQDYVSLPELSEFEGATGKVLTYSLWAKTSDNTSSGVGPFNASGWRIFSEGNVNDCSGFASINNFLGTSKFFRYLGCSVSGTTGGTINDDQWHYIAATVEPSNGVNHPIYHYQDGALYDSETIGNDLSPSVTTATIGAYNNGSSLWLWYTGQIDEVRVSSVARSAEWIEAEYLNQSDPFNYVTVGAPEGQAPSLYVQNIIASPNIVASSADYYSPAVVGEQGIKIQGSIDTLLAGRADAGVGYGVFGTSLLSYGIAAFNTVDIPDVAGFTLNGNASVIGVLGRSLDPSADGKGIYGYSSNGNGVEARVGVASTLSAAEGKSLGGGSYPHAVSGEGGAFAGYFDGEVKIDPGGSINIGGITLNEAQIQQLISWCTLTNHC